MKCAAEMGSGVMRYVPGFIKIDAGIQKLMSGRSTEHRHADSMEIFSFFQNKKRRLKNQSSHFCACWVHTAYSLSSIHFMFQVFIRRIKIANSTTVSTYSRRHVGHYSVRSCDLKKLSPCLPLFLPHRYRLFILLLFPLHLLTLPSYT
jgi:hypothetical protein